MRKIITNEFYVASLAFLVAIVLFLSINSLVSIFIYKPSSIIGSFLVSVFLGIYLFSIYAKKRYVLTESRNLISKILLLYLGFFSVFFCSFFVIINAVEFYDYDKLLIQDLLLLSLFFALPLVFVFLIIFKSFFDGKLKLVSGEYEKEGEKVRQQSKFTFWFIVVISVLLLLALLVGNIMLGNEFYRGKKIREAYRNNSEEIQRDYYVGSIGVYYKRWARVSKADPETFEIIDHGYAKDAKHIFYEHRIADVEDRGSFEAIYDSYAKDDKNVYYKANRVLGLDPETFEVLSDFWLRDKNAIYRYGNSVGPDCEMREGADIYFYADEEPVCHYWRRMTEIDSETFEVLDDFYVDDSDNSLFEIMSDFYSKDKNSVYYHTDRLEGADVENFRVLRLDCATDGKNYFKGKEMTKESCEE